MNGKILAALAVVIVIAVAAAAILLNNNGDGGEDSGSDPALKTEFAVGDYYEVKFDFGNGASIQINRYDVTEVANGGMLTVEYTETVDSVESGRETMYCTYGEFLDTVIIDTANKVDRGYEVIDTYLGELNCHVWEEGTEGADGKMWVYDGITMLATFYISAGDQMIEGTMELTAGTIFE